MADNVSGQKIYRGIAGAFPDNIIPRLCEAEYAPEITVTHIDTDKLLMAINDLPPREADIIRRRYESKLTLNDIATLYGVSANRIQQILHQGFRHLRSKCGKYQFCVYTEDEYDELDDRCFEQNVYVAWIFFRRNTVRVHPQNAEKWGIEIDEKWRRIDSGERAVRRKSQRMK